MKYIPEFTAICAAMIRWECGVQTLSGFASVNIKKKSILQALLDYI